MSAATVDRVPVTIEITVGNFETLKVKAGEKILRGALVTTDASDFAYDAEAGTGKTCAGYAESTVDNTNGADGDVYVNVCKGRAIRLESAGGGGAVTAAHKGKRVYILDNQTVTNSPTDTVPAGVLHSICPDTGKPFVHVGSTALLEVPA